MAKYLEEQLNFGQKIAKGDDKKQKTFKQAILSFIKGIAQGLQQLIEFIAIILVIAPAIKAKFYLNKNEESFTPSQESQVQLHTHQKSLVTKARYNDRTVPRGKLWCDSEKVPREDGK